MSPKTLIPSLFLACLLSACTREEAPADFVSDYSPRLLQPAGTPLEGDWFPLVPGQCRGYLGGERGSLASSLNGKAEGETPFDTSVVAYARVGRPQPLILPSGTYTAFPMEEAIGAEGWMRYFTRDDGAVQIRAIRRGEGEPVEVVHPVYFEAVLAVGDAWETEPQVDMDKLLDRLEGMDATAPPRIEMAMKCRFFALGKETLIVGGGAREAMAVEQRAEATGTFSVAEDTGKTLAAHFTIRLSGTLHFERDSGLVRQDLAIEAEFAGTATQSAGPYSPRLEDRFTLSLRDRSTLEYDPSGLTCPLSPKSDTAAGPAADNPSGPAVRKLAAGSGPDVRTAVTAIARALVKSLAP